MQLWPANEKALPASRAAASSRSASASTITGVALPSSSATCLRGARSFSFQPTSPLPVKVSAATRSSPTSTSPISAEGRRRRSASPAAARPPARAPPAGARRAGVAVAGLSTTAQPAASAGAILCATRLSGKLNGLIAPTTPIGTRRVKASLPSPACEASIGTTSPASFRAWTAAIRVGGHRPRRLDACGLQRLAGLGADRLGDLLVAAAEVAGDLDQDLGPLVGRERLAHRLGGGVDRLPGLGGARLGDPTDDLARVRRADVDPIAGLDPLAADQKPLLGGRGRHARKSRLCPMEPDIRYARNGDVAIAYQVVGDGGARPRARARTSSPTSSTRGSRPTGASSTSGWRARSG